MDPQAAGVQHDRLYDDLQREKQLLENKLREIRNSADYYKIELLSKQLTIISTIQSSILKLKKLKRTFENSQT
jgi:hypothetical protein